MNDKEILNDIAEGFGGMTEDEVLKAMQKARQDERLKLQSENAELRRRHDIFRKTAEDLAEENAELKARWEKLKPPLLSIHICDGCGNRCDKHIDEWCDIIGLIMEEQLSSGGSSSKPGVAPSRTPGVAEPKPEKKVNR